MIIESELTMPKSRNNRKSNGKGPKPTAPQARDNEQAGGLITRRRVLGAMFAGGLAGGAAAIRSGGGLSSVFGGGDAEFVEYAHESTNLPTVARDFSDYIALESQDRFVLVDFHAEWCPPCRALSPNLLPGAESSGEDILVVKANVMDRFQRDTNLGAISELKNTGYFPELHIYRDGQLIAEHSGYLEIAEVADFIQGAADNWRENAPQASLNNDAATYG